jgi:hypothetical protein
MKHKDNIGAYINCKRCDVPRFSYLSSPRIFCSAICRSLYRRPPYCQTCKGSEDLRPLQYKSDPMTGQKIPSSWRCRTCNRNKVSVWRNSSRGQFILKQRRSTHAYRETTRRYYLLHPEIRNRQRYATQRLKMDVLTHYAGPRPRCKCCGEDQILFLTLDHINGGGNAHRRSIFGKKSGNMYYWIRKNNYPVGFQVLCWNCNCGKRQLAQCPHQSNMIVGPPTASTI